MGAVMKRVLSFGAIVGAALVAGLTPAPRSTAAEAPPPRPNIVVVMADDQTVDSMRVMANVNALLGEQGTTFADNYASFPLCCPSRTTFLTGQYGHNHTVMGNALPQGAYEKLAPTHANTLPAWLKLAGYHTVHIGKYLNGYGRQRPTEVPAGWDEWFGSVDPSTYRFYDYTLNENGKLVRYGTAPGDYQADVYTAKAVDAVKRLAPHTEPFLRGADAADARVQRGGRLGQAARGPAAATPRQPAHQRGHRDVSPAARVAARRRRGRCGDRERAAGQRRARPDAHRLHRGQRLLPRGAPDPQWKGAALRAVGAGSAGPARPRRPARVADDAAGRERRPRPDDRRRGERQSGEGHGRHLAARPARRSDAFRGP